MERETRDRLLAIADAKTASAGVDGLHGFVDQACTVFEKLAQYLGQMRTRDGLIAVLDRAELTEEDERMAIAMTQHFGHFVREALTALIDLGIKELPPVPSGRRRVLTPDLASKINAYVLHLFANDVDLKRCKKRAAQRFGVSDTTVQRAWSARGKVPTSEIDATEFIDFVRKKLATTWIVPNGSIVEVAKTEYKAISEGTFPEETSLAERS